MTTWWRGESRSATWFHFGPEARRRGPDPARADYGTFASFSDPDGNGWLLQERKGQPVR